MKIAIFGATSEIAKDLILSFLTHSDHELVLFSRRPKEVMQWLTSASQSSQFTSLAFESLKEITDLDAILNFVGAGDPAKISDIGANIFEVTLRFDDLAVEYIKLHPLCRYIFMSSGAAYGSEFHEPVGESSFIRHPINNVRSQDWYGISKMHSEYRHRALSNLNIVDVRIFNYFSRTQNINTRYLISDAIRAIKSDEILRTSHENIIRDYLAPQDFYQLIEKILRAPPENIAIDCYSKAPIDKNTLLIELHKIFGLKYEFLSAEASINSRSRKPSYYSCNKSASRFGYAPQYTSLEAIVTELNNFK